MFDDLIKKHVHEIAQHEGFVNYQFQTTAGSSVDDNFLSIMTAITLSGLKHGRNKAETLHLLCKTPLKTGSNLLFAREIFIYSKLLPAFLEFQREKRLDKNETFLSVPRLFGCEADEMNGMYILIMEDLRANNYKMWPKDVLFTLDHLLLIMRELGKFHAISFAMKDQRPQQFAEFKCLRDETFENDLQQTVGTFMMTEIERATDALIDPKHKRMMKQFQTTYSIMVREYLLGQSSDEFAVITHGDCWCNNFLFRYDDGNNTELCILDWQIARYCPPVLDLLYVIFSSTDKTFRDQHYDTLITTYYSALSAMIQRLGSDPMQLYTFEQLQMQLRKFGDFALLCAPIIISLRLAKTKTKTKVDTNEMNRTADGETAHITNEYDEQSQIEYNRMIRELVDDLVSYGYIRIV